MINFELSNIDNLKAIFGFINDLSQNINIRFNISYIQIVVMDPTRTCMSKIKLSSDYFDNYNCSNEIVIGINCESFVKVLKMCDNDSQLNLVYDYKDYVELTIVNGKHKSKFRLKLLDLDNDDIHIEDLGYKTNILMNMSQMCKDLSNIKILNGEDCTIDVSKQSFNISANTDSGEIEFVYETDSNTDNLKIFKIDKSHIIDMSINKILNVVKLNSINNFAVVSIGNNLPLFVKYTISNKSYINYWIAPKMSDYE